MSVLFIFSVSDQFYFYSNPQSTSYSGDYFGNSEEYSYSDGFYYYDYYPVYYLHPK